MSKINYEFKDEYIEELYYEMNIFSYLYNLKKNSVINEKKYFELLNKLDAAFRTIDDEVRLNDVVYYMLNNFYSKEVSWDEALEFVKSENFNYENIVEKVKTYRVLKNAEVAAERINKIMISTLEEITNEE